MIRYTFEQFARAKNLTVRWVRKLAEKTNYTSIRVKGEVFDLTRSSTYENGKPRFLVVQEDMVRQAHHDTEMPRYINPSNWSADQILQVENLYADFDGNIRKVADASGLEYWCVRRYFKKEFKRRGDCRRDCGALRSLRPSVELVKPSFQKWLFKNAQRNVALSIEKVAEESGIQIPRRVAYKWADEFKASHTMAHYYKRFIAEFTPHVRRDNWIEYENFLDCILCDVWKIDDRILFKKKQTVQVVQDGIQAPVEIEKGTEQIGTAYAIAFIDMKTRYPLNVEITAHSVTGSDVKTGMLHTILNWGKPKQWVLDNGHEFINKENLNFLLGLYENREGTKRICVSKGGDVVDTRTGKTLRIAERIGGNGGEGTGNSTAGQEGDINLDVIRKSLPYNPNSAGKGIIERTFRIWKDEWAAYSRSYSPNMQESRKPSLQLSAVAPTHTLNELAISFHRFLYNDFLHRERESFLSPFHSKVHPIQKDRPKTIQEAFDRSYASFAPDRPDDFKLAYLYAEKRKALFTNATVSFVYPVTQEKMFYIPEDFEEVLSYSGKQVSILIDPHDIYHAWIFDLNGKLLSEARDFRSPLENGMKRDVAAEIGKIRRKITKIEREKVKLVEYIEEIQPVSATATEMGEHSVLNLLSKGGRERVPVTVDKDDEDWQALAENFEDGDDS